MLAKVRKQKNPLPSRLLRNEANASRHINILGHYNNDTLIDKSGKLIQIIQLAGINGLTQYVFTFRDKPISRMLNSAWKKARVRSSLAHVRVHDLKHTFGRRLRAAEVSFEDRQDLLGHKSGRITTHYSQSEYNNLIRAANKVCDIGNRLVILNRKEKLPAPAKVPQGNFKEVKADLKII